MPGPSLPGPQPSGATWLAARSEPATVAVETTMYRALAVLRSVVLVNTVVLNIWFWEAVERPALAVVVLTGITVWTAVAVWAYDAPGRRGLPLLLTDLLVTVTAILLSPAVKAAPIESTVPGFWVMGVVLAWGVHGHWIGGLVASLAVSVADLAIRGDLSQTNYGNIFLLMIGGPVLGYTSGLLKEMAAARDRAEREAAAAAERARLARVVHDGVLQVLALVQRRGHELGGEAVELGRLAGEQEAALRALVQSGASSSAADRHGADTGPAGTADLAQALRGLGDSRVSVSVPPTSVRVPLARTDEIVAAVRACLDNVIRHVGADARAWVLLEDLGRQVVVTVRDEGPGIPVGRLEEAAAEGRLGVTQSIRGRVGELGGTATLVTAPGRGTEWELTFPR
jgi:signal transduction histidine kinase